MSEQTLDCMTQRRNVEANTSTEQATSTHIQNLTPAADANSVSTDSTNSPAQSASQSSPSARAWGDSSDEDDFDYIPVSPWAPLAFSLGVFSLSGFLGIFGLYLAGFSIFVGITAVFRIRASAGFVKGTGFALTGLVLSTSSLLLGSAKMAHAYSTEVPEGFLRVNFPKDVAEKQFIYIGGHRKLHPDVARLIDRKVYLKGFMWATQDTEGLPYFILLKDNGECCFGGRPRSHDYIYVRLPNYKQGERPPLSYRSSGLEEVKLTNEQKNKLKASHDYQLTTRAYLGMVAVAGILHADVKAGETGSPEDFEYALVYSMDAELVEDAWTRF